MNLRIVLVLCILLCSVERGVGQDDYWLCDTTFKITQSVFQQDFVNEFNYRCARFKSPVYFIGAELDSIKYEFHKVLSMANDSLSCFEGTEFESTTHFLQAKFDSLAHFGSAQFGSSAHFGSAQFGSNAYFGSAQFGLNAYFGNAQFRSNANFIWAQFESDADFGRTQFGSNAYFRSVQFGSNAYFGSAQFGSNADFGGTQFGSSADFNYAQFKGEVLLSKTTLPDTLLFSNIKEIKHTIDFTHSMLDTGATTCYIDLTETDISKIKLRYSIFQLIFSDTSTSFEQKSNVYEQLLKTQKEYGYTESYEKLDKEYKELQSLYYRGKLINFVEKYWWGYGYEKWRVVLNSVVILLFFSLLNYSFLSYLNTKVYKIENIWKSYHKKARYKLYTSNKQKYSDNPNYIEHRYYRDIGWAAFVYSFFYTSLIFFGLRMTVDNINFSNKWGVLYLFFQYTVGLVCLAYIANFIIVS